MSVKENDLQNQFEISIEGIIQGKPRARTDNSDVFKVFGDAIQDYEQIINCQKLPENDLTKIKDLYIEIGTPVKIKPGGLSFSYYQYTIKTNPIGYSVVRKLSDFELLFESLPKFNSGKFNPLLPKFPMSLADDSDKKLLFLRYYLNSLVEDDYYKSLPIVISFLSLPQSEWDKVAKKFQKMKEITNIENIYNLEGFHDIKITYDNDFRAMKIKEDIKMKEEYYEKLNDNLDELFPIMEKMSLCFKNISQDLLNLKNIYADGKKCTELISGCFHQLYLVIKTWGEDYIKQKNFLKNEFKYFLKYISKERSSFLKNLENYEDIKEKYKKKFMKYQKLQSPSTKEEEELKENKNLFGFHLTSILEEYEKLNERHGKRINKQFFLYSKQKELLFQDYDNFYRLFNFKTNYSVPDVSVSYIGKPNEILNNLDISKISRNENEEKDNNNISSMNKNSNANNINKKSTNNNTIITENDKEKIEEQIEENNQKKEGSKSEEKIENSKINLENNEKEVEKEEKEDQNLDEENNEKEKEQEQEISEFKEDFKNIENNNEDNFEKIQDDNNNKDDNENENENGNESNIN